MGRKEYKFSGKARKIAGLEKYCKDNDLEYFDERLLSSDALDAGNLDKYLAIYEHTISAVCMAYRKERENMGEFEILENLTLEERAEALKVENIFELAKVDVSLMTHVENRIVKLSELLSSDSASYKKFENKYSKLIKLLEEMTGGIVGAVNVGDSMPGKETPYQLVWESDLSPEEETRLRGIIEKRGRGEIVEKDEADEGFVIGEGDTQIWLPNYFTPKKKKGDEKKD